MARLVAPRSHALAARLPEWIRPQLTELVDAAPEGPAWLREIKFDGYRMHARLDRCAVRLLTRTGHDRTHKYPAIAAAISSIGARQAYLDGELCVVRADRTTSFGMIQLASDSGNAAALGLLSVRSSLPRRRRSPPNRRRLESDPGGKSANGSIPS